MKPCVKIGTDCVYVPRILPLLKAKKEIFWQRLFTSKEREQLERALGIPLPEIQELKNSRKKKTCLASLAARYAAKEALLKALETGLAKGFSFQDFEIQGGFGQAPYYVFHKKMQRYLEEKHLASVSLSLSHDGDYATASCVFLFWKDTSKEKMSDVL